MTEETDLARLAVALERSTSWLRRMTRPAEWNAVAMSTLDAVARTGPHRVSDLVAAEHITQPGMTALVARLETAGFIERSADPTDGRATLVSITATGRAYLDEFHAQRAASVVVHLRALPPAALASLVDATDALDLLTTQTIEEKS